MKSDAFGSKSAIAIADEEAETGESKVISRYDKQVTLLQTGNLIAKGRPLKLHLCFLIDKKDLYSSIQVLTRPLLNIMLFKNNQFDKYMK